MQGAPVEPETRAARSHHGGAAADVRGVLADEQQHLPHVVNQRGDEQIRIVDAVRLHRFGDLERVHELADQTEPRIRLVDALREALEQLPHRDRSEHRSSVLVGERPSIVTGLCTATGTDRADVCHPSPFGAGLGAADVVPEVAEPPHCSPLDRAHPDLHGAEACRVPVTEQRHRDVT